MCCAFSVLDQPVFWERNLLERAPKCSVVGVGQGKGWHKQLRSEWKSTVSLVLVWMRSVCCSQGRNNAVSGPRPSPEPVQAGEIF